MNTTGKIQAVVQTDLDLWNNILELDYKYFPQPWSVEGWNQMDPKHHGLFAWVMNGTVLGFALFQLIPGDETAHLLKILVIPDQRGSGLASQIWEQVIPELKNRQHRQVYLEVEAANHPAQNFYRKVGFKDLRVLKKYYSNGSDALAMQLTL